MSVATSEVVPEPMGGGPGTVPRGSTLLRPRDPATTAVPARARRMDRRPLPRLRPLAEVLAEAGVAPAPVEDPPVAGDDADADVAGGPAWDAALEAAAAQVGPLAVGLLTAVAEVLDGRRPFTHLARLCPAPLVERVQVGLARVAPGFPRRARVRGLRLCPVVGTPGTDGSPGLAVEVAAALCGQGTDGQGTSGQSKGGRGRGAAGTGGQGEGAPRPDGSRTRAAVARFELDATRTWRVTELAVL
jgi:hypothetical protein